jgi:hypothetical protein
VPVSFLPIAVERRDSPHGWLREIRSGDDRSGRLRRIDRADGTISRLLARRAPAI